MNKEDEMNLESILDELNDWASEKEEYDKAVVEQSEESGRFFEEIADAYENDPDNDPLNILTEDEYLLEELADKLSLVSLIEMSDEELSPEQAEAPYLSLLDTVFETAKVVNPLAGFGRDRLEAGLGILRDFEKRYWPLITRVSSNNAQVFRSIIPGDNYDDIFEGRKMALGAVRHKEDEMYVAGVVVFEIKSIPQDEAKDIRIDWLYVSERYRKSGVGNMLMAEVAGYALQFEGSSISLDMNIPVLKSDDENEDFAVLENFLDSWKFGFSVRTGNEFYLKLSDLKDNKYLKGSTESACSLADLGMGGRDMLKRFFKSLNHSYDTDMMNTGYSFFDPKVSCVIVRDKSIRAMLLFHRLANGNYRYEIMRSQSGNDPTEIIKLIRYSYGAAIDMKAEDAMVYGSFESDEGFLSVKKMFPTAWMPMKYHGVLSLPGRSEVISSEQWGLLRQEAGFSDDKIPQGMPGDEEYSQDRMNTLLKFLNI